MSVRRIHRMLELRPPRPLPRRSIEAIGVKLDRRDFLKGLGAGLLICLSPTAGTCAGVRAGAFGGHELPKDVNAWMHMRRDGKVKVFTGKVEVGQNIRTSLAQAVAEELRMPFASIEMIMGDTDHVPWDMGTFGSRTTPTMGRNSEDGGSGAQMLMEMAA